MKNQTAISNKSLNMNAQKLDFILHPKGSKTGKYFLLFFLLFSFQQFVFSSADMSFSYKSNLCEFNLFVNVSTGFAQEGVVFRIKEWLPYILGLEKIAKETNQHFIIDTTFFYSSKKEISVRINHNKTIKIKNLWNLGDNIREISRIVGRKISPIHRFQGFTLQLSYKKDFDSITREIKQLDQQFTDYAMIPKDMLFRIDGDVTIPPLSLYRANDGGYAIRYGIFGTRSQAKKAIQELQLDEKKTKIIQSKFDVKKLEMYYCRE